MFSFLKFFLFLAAIANCCCKDVLELHGVNFELYLSSYRYIAILFYDSSTRGMQLEQAWVEAADGIELQSESEIAKIHGSDPDLKELVDAYGIAVPSIRVFRRGAMSDYRGPYSDPIAIGQYLKEDSQPSVRIITDLNDLRQQLLQNSKTIVLGCFDPSVIVEDDGDSYSIDPWGQFQAAADSLRGHATLYAVISDDILNSFQVKKSELPAIYMIPEEGDNLLPYKGEILELNLSEWVLRNSAPSMGELSFSEPSGELYATQFFSSRKLKFILFIRASDIASTNTNINVIEAWQDVSKTFKGKALFAYMVQDAVADVVEYFNIDVQHDLPLIVAHEPSHDHKYKSKRLEVLDKEAMQEFVVGVTSGFIKRLVKSEPESKNGSNKGKGNNSKERGGGNISKVGHVSRVSDKSLVIKAVGTNVVDIVSEVDKDVLLEVYAPWCAHCKKLMPTYDILGKAVQGENRIKLVKIDGTANDLPPHWGVKNYPTLLWFPAKDKPYNDSNIIIPRPYWDAGHSLHELLSFVIREGSFDAKTLKVATSEQVGSLLGDEETLRARYEAEERSMRRNEGREVFENPWVDFIMGEVVFDGKRWHFAAAAVLCLVTIVCFILLLIKSSASADSESRKRK